MTALSVDPRNANVIYAGTADLGGWGTGGLFKSIDSGQTWQKLGDGAAYTVLIDPANLDVVDHFTAGPCDVYAAAFLYDPSSPGTLYCGANAKVFRTTDAGNTWLEFGFKLKGRVNSLAFSPSGSPKLYAATTAGLFVIDTLDP